MKLLLENTDPDLCKLLSNKFGEKTLLVLNKMSDTAVVKSLQQGKLEGIPPDMKLSQTKFYHGYLGKKELIVQVAPKKVAVFYGYIMCFEPESIPAFFICKIMTESYELYW